MRNRVNWRYALPAVLVLLVALVVLVLAVGGTAQLPGTSDISSSELGYIATGQAQQDVDLHVVRVTCPPGTFHPGDTVLCQARLRLAHLVTRSEQISVAVHRDDGGGLYVDVRAA